MLRFLLFIAAYFGASFLSFTYHKLGMHKVDTEEYPNYFESYSLTHEILIDLILGPLGSIGYFGTVRFPSGLLELWIVESVIVISFLSLACFRKERRKRVFWWCMLAGFWLLTGVYEVFVSMY